MKDLKQEFRINDVMICLYPHDMITIIKIKVDVIATLYLPDGTDDHCCMLRLNHTCLEHFYQNHLEL
ncbi:MAG: hypothetical protein ABJA70_17485 [Chryseolinea sp.]